MKKKKGEEEEADDDDDVISVFYGIRRGNLDMTLLVVNEGIKKNKTVIILLSALATVFSERTEMKSPKQRYESGLMSF